MTLKNYLVIFGLIVATVFTSCKKDEEEPAASGSDAPKISVNATTSGEIITVPQNASSANGGQFNSIITNINQIGTFLTALNSVPENAKVTSRSTNSTTTYYWTISDQGGTYEVWYTVVESGENYTLTYDIAANTPDLTISRTTYISGWVAKNGKNGHLVFNYEAFTGEDGEFNYTYDWNTNSVGDLHILAHWNIDSGIYTDMIYEVTVYADGSGNAEHRYSDSDNNIVWHYEWNADWTVISWTYTVNGEEDREMSGEWNA